MEKIVTCPICKNILEKSENSLKCKNNHCFDISKENYVNLLNIKEKKSLSPGDNELMINARQNFLNKNYYLPLAEKLVEIITKSDNNYVLECGAGDGYYISNINKAIQNNCYATDISKVAVKKCAKRNKNLNCFVASSYFLPFQDKSFDVVLVCFAPFCEQEVFRVLKDDGLLLIVKPDKQHLLELRQVLFGQNLEQEKNNYIYKQFNLIEIEKLKYNFFIDNNQDIQDLFQMTPYYYKSSNTAKERIKKLKNINLTSDFEICLLKKK